jgi:hypothetical protein
MTQTIVNLGTGGAALNGQNGSTAGADSNDALFLDWDGENYVYLSGVTGNYMSVPDEAALDITGDIDLRAYVALDEWPPAADSDVINKWSQTDTANRSYSLGVADDSKLYLLLTDSGVNTTIVDSTSAVSATDGDALWIRVTLDVDNGASGYEVKFYTSDDGSTWTQLGATVTGAGTTDIQVTTTDVSIGRRSNATSRQVTGKVYRAQVFNGIDGTKVLDVDTSVITTGAATSFTALTGQTVTINRSTSGRKSVAVVSPVWLFGTDDYMEVADNDLIDFGASDSFTVLAVVRQWANTVSTGRYLSKRTAAGGAGYHAFGSGTASYNFQINDGTTTGGGGVTMTLGKLETAAFVTDRSGEILERYLDGAFVFSSSISGYGDISNSESLAIGRVTNVGGGYQDFELIAVAIFRRALAATEITQISDYYQARLS